MSRKSTPPRTPVPGGVFFWATACWAIGDLSALRVSGRRREQMQIAIAVRWPVGSRSHVNDCQHADDNANGRHSAYNTSRLFPISHDHLTPRVIYAPATIGCQG